MKKATILLLILVCSYSVFAQQKNYIKAGLNYSSQYKSKIEKVNYPGFEFSFERTFTPHSSFIFSYGYFKTDEQTYLPENASGNYRFVTRFHNFIPTYRYYFGKDVSGLFLQAAIPFVYYEETSYFKKSSLQSTNGNLNDSKFRQSSMDFSTLVGIGLRHHFNANMAVEMNFNYSPTTILDVNYGAAGYFQTGIKFSYGVGKKK